MFNNFLVDNRALSEIIWKYKYSRAGIDDHMARGHYTLNTEGYIYTHTHTEYVKLIAFPPQQQLHEYVVMLH
jgi:hypothetical protein